MVTIDVRETVRPNGIHLPRVECADGFTMSVQGNNGAYCEPRDDSGVYSEMEIGYPSEKEELLMPYMEQAFSDKETDPTDTVYPYVPVEVILQVIAKHGGCIKNCLTEGTEG
jgi:hypothetical protein